MRVLQISREKLVSLDLDPNPESDLEVACQIAWRRGATLWAVHLKLWRVVVLEAEKALWTDVLVAAGFTISEESSMVHGEYGDVDIVMTTDNVDQLYWIERVSPPTGDLEAGTGEVVFDVSHVNPLGETERERVRAGSALDAVENYAAQLFDLYGTSHHPNGEGFLHVDVVDEGGYEEAFDLFANGEIGPAVS